MKEQNLVLSELGRQRVAKDYDEQKVRGIARGVVSVEEHPHRLRYTEVQITLKHIKQVLRERADAEFNPKLKAEMIRVIEAK
ncbi:MAG: hypothetical protein WDW38_005366 [Sanguina aurantia]